MTIIKASENNKFELTYTQCKQIVESGLEVGEMLEKLNDQPSFMCDGMEVNSVATIKSIIQGGCAGDAHKSIYHYEALTHMVEHGDDVLAYIEDCFGELPELPESVNYSQMACFYLSTAIECWCNTLSDDLHGVDWE